LTLASSCSSVAPVRPPDDFAPVAAVSSIDFPGATRILTGFAPADADPALRTGDAALLGLEFHRHGAVQRQLLLMEVSGLGWTTWQVAGKQFTRRRTTTARRTTTDSDGPSSSQDLQVHDIDLTIRRFDATGEALTQSQAVLYEEALRAGWWPYTVPDADETDSVFASLLLFSLQNLAHSDPALQELLFLVVDKPNLLSLVTHLGVTLVIESRHRERTLVVPSDLLDLPGRLEVRVAAMDLRINGTMALWADLLAVRPTGALGVCGGLVGAIARHPTEPGRFAVARLLATRRGANVEVGSFPGL
jgi:hypothetical protein